MALALLRYFLCYYLVSLIINFGWELAHGSFFADVPPFFQHLPYLGLASLADALICLALLLTTGLAYRDLLWAYRGKIGHWLGLLGLSAVVSIGIEYTNWAILERWRYTANMPRLPLVGIGLTPFLQMSLSPSLSAFLTNGIMSYKSKAENG